MNCPHCKAQWNVPGLAVEKCPFCGKDLKEKHNKTANTLEDAMAVLVEMSGKEVLSDSKKVLGLFADIAPALDKERRLLKNFLDANLSSLKAIVAVSGDTALNQQILYRKTVVRLVDDWSMREDAAVRICRCYFTAAGAALPPEEPPAQPPKVAAAPRTADTRKPAPKPEPAKSAASQSSLTAPVFFGVQGATAQTAPKSEPTQSAATKSGAAFSSTVKTGTAKSAAAKTGTVRPPAAKTTPASNQINSYQKYLAALDRFFLTLYPAGQQRPLNRDEIEYFIYDNNLNIGYNLDVHDVHKDLEQLYAKYRVPKPWKYPDAIYRDPALAKKIATYGQYRQALKDYYYANHKTLSDAKIITFLRQYDLDRRFNIKIADVRKDIRYIP